jgi:tetratricopeptide (TPR) repeat protein
MIASVAKNKLLFVLSAAAVAAGIALACAQKSGPTQESPPDDAVDTELVAYLSRARALHHEANIKEEMGDHDGAIASMDRLTSLKFSRAGAPEVEEVLADAFARRAEIELSSGKLEDAKTSLAKGLDHAHEPTYFRGHLVEVSGLVDEALAKKLADAGRADEAKKTQERALTELEEAISIQDKVLKTLLADGGSR